jgi:hypothetical protein
VQMTNLLVRVWDKAGNPLTAPFKARAACSPRWAGSARRRRRRSDRAVRSAGRSLAAEPVCLCQHQQPALLPNVSPSPRLAIPPGRTIYTICHPQRVPDYRKLGVWRMAVHDCQLDSSPTADHSTVPALTPSTGPRCWWAIRRRA